MLLFLYAFARVIFFIFSVLLRRFLINVYVVFSYVLLMVFCLYPLFACALVFILLSSDFLTLLLLTFAHALIPEHSHRTLSLARGLPRGSLPTLKFILSVYLG